MNRVEVPKQISADQLWFRNFSVLIQRWNTLPEIFRTWNIQFITWNIQNSAASALSSSENPKFQSSTSALNSAESVLIFSESELIQSRFFLKQRWNTEFSEEKNQLWTALFEHWFSPEQSWWPLKSSETTLINPDFLWDSAKHPWTLIFSILVLTWFFPVFFKENFNLTLSGNWDLIPFQEKLDLNLFSQFLSRKLRPYAPWNIRSYFRFAKTKTFFAKFPQEISHLTPSGYKNQLCSEQFQS